MVERRLVVGGIEYKINEHGYFWTGSAKMFHLAINAVQGWFLEYSDGRGDFSWYPPGPVVVARPSGARYPFLCLRGTGRFVDLPPLEVLLSAAHERYEREMKQSVASLLPEVK